MGLTHSHTFICTPNSTHKFKNTHIFAHIDFHIHTHTNLHTHTHSPRDFFFSAMRKEVEEAISRLGWRFKKQLLEKIFLSAARKRLEKQFLLLQGFFCDGE